MYRDDHEAALERVAKLEHELRTVEERAAGADALRAELAALRAELAKAKDEAHTLRRQLDREQEEERGKKRAEEERRRKRAASSSDAPEESRGGTRGRIARGLLAGGLTAVALGTTVAVVVLAPLHCAGELSDVRLVTLDGEPLLLVRAYVGAGPEGSDDRLTLVRPSDGERLAVATADSSLDFVAQRGSRVWMISSDDDLHVRDLATLEILATTEDLRAHSELSPGFAAVDVCAIGTTPEHERDLRVRAADGRTYLIDSMKLTVRPADGPAGSDSCPSSSVRTSSVSVGERLVRFEGDGREALRVGDEPIVEGETYLDPAFVADGATGHAIVLDDPTGMLVEHRTTMNEDGHVLLARVGMDGAPAWTIDLGEGRGLRAAFSLGDRVVLFTDAEALGVDPARGRVVWRSPL